MACSLSITRGYFTLRTANVVYKKEVASLQGEPELVPVTTPRNMKQLRNLHYKQVQLSRISHDDMYNLHEIAYDIPGYIHKIITFPDLVCHLVFLIHERKFANTHKELFKQCVQDVPAIRKAKYPLVIDREQAMINAIEAKLPVPPDCSVQCVPYFSRRNRSIPFRSVLDFSNYRFSSSHQKHVERLN